MDDSLDDWIAPPRLVLREIVRLRRLLDELEARYVCLAREWGAPWRELGVDLGLSGQAAHRRHGARDPIAARLAELEQALERELGGPFPRASSGAARRGV